MIAQYREWLPKQADLMAALHTLRGKHSVPDDLAIVFPDMPSAAKGLMYTGANFHRVISQP